MNRRSDFIVPPIVLDRASAIPLQKQVYAQIAAAIRSGALHKGARIPSTRTMATLLRVSRNTVFAAYEELICDQLLTTRERTGTRVNGVGPPPALTLFGLRAVVRAAHFPARTQPFEDPDGNSLYLNLK
jgi:GntR family transcriptional regulator/MocR family aminotransferase